MPGTRCAAAVALVLAAACNSPSDVVSDAPTFTPLLDGAGRYRVTFGPGPDVARGFLPDGRLLFRAFGLAPFGSGWVLTSVPPDGGIVREEAGVYRPALVGQIGTLVTFGDRSALVMWKEPIAGGHGCPDSSATDLGNPGPAPRPPTPVDMTIYSLASAARAITALPVRQVSLHVAFLDSQMYEGGIFTERRRVRVSPALRDVNRTGANAFGPVILPDSVTMIYSDGETLWRADMLDTASAPVALGAGAFPALGPDGQTLAYARPWGVDSTMQLFTVPLPLGVCYQTQIEIVEAGWEVVVRDLQSGADRVMADGLDPAWDPASGRLVIRNASLEWLDLTAGTATPIPATDGAFAPAVSPDGRILAFSLLISGAASDVYFLRLP